MSLHPLDDWTIPADTAQVTRAIFPHGSPYVVFRDTVGTIYHDTDFADLFPRRGQPAASPGRLALVLILQFAEGLSDRQAADAVRTRIDWKYVLGLDLADPGFDASVLCEFRQRLLTSDLERLLLDRLLDQARTAQLLQPRGRQRTDSTRVLAAIQHVNRLECIGETMRQALNVLATAVPTWLQSWVPAVWFERYSRRFEEFRLPQPRAARYALASTIGTDGFQLLTMLAAPSAPPGLRDLPAIQILWEVWRQQFYALRETAQWRSAEDCPPASRLINSPYDPEAHFAKKRRTSWVGYKVHLTETCEPDYPHLITAVQTTGPALPDHQVLPELHTQLAARTGLPTEHVVDAGYMTGDDVVQSLARGVPLLGPIIKDWSWQARANAGFDVSVFTVDWEQRRVQCPQGQWSRAWSPYIDHLQRAVITVQFPASICQNCPVRTACTRTKGRRLTLQAHEHHETMMAIRRRQSTEDFRKAYAVRAGIEGTMSQAVHRSGLRRARYRGHAKLHLQAVVTAAALNVVRMGEWLLGTPFARTRRSAFARLAH